MLMGMIHSTTICKLLGQLLVVGSCWHPISNLYIILGSMIWPSSKCQHNSNLPTFDSVQTSWGPEVKHTSPNAQSMPSICDQHYSPISSWGYLYVYIYIALYSNTVVNIILNHGQPSDFVPWDFMASILRSVMLSERALRNSDSE